MSKPSGILTALGIAVTGILFLGTVPLYAQGPAPLPKTAPVTPTIATDVTITKEISALINQLLKDDPELVEEARVELLEISRPAVPFLIEALKSEQPALRYMACEILAELRDEKALPGLVNLLNDKGEYTASIASAAIRALGRLGEPSVIPSLMEVTNSADVDMRYEALKALGILRAREAITLTLRALSDTAQTFLGYQVRCAAIETLGRLKNPAAVPELVKLLENKETESATEWSLAQYAIKALEKITIHSEGSIVWRDEKQQSELIWRWKDWWTKHKKEYGIEEPPPPKENPPEKKSEEVKPAEEKPKEPEKKPEEKPIPPPNDKKPEEKK